MILVIQKKAGVGCTVLSYNLSKLLNIQLYAQPSSFLFDEDNFGGNAIDVLPITDNIENGILDIGSKYVSKEDNKRMNKLVNTATVALIPMDLGYECFLSTLDTMFQIRQWNKNLPIVLVLNRLDSNDGERDFKAKKDLIELFRERASEFIEFTGDDYYDNDEKNPILPSFENNSNILLTYLRNSFGLSYGIEKGEYFLDNYKYTGKFVKDENGNIVNGELDSTDKKEFYIDAKKRLSLHHDNFDFRFFRYLFFLTICKTNYTDTYMYIQGKDMVRFRVRCQNGLGNFIDKKNKSEFEFKDNSFKKFNKNSDFYKNNKKLLKDIAYIVYAITSTQNDRNNGIENFCDIKNNYI